MDIWIYGYGMKNRNAKERKIERKNRKENGNGKENGNK
jgi:hypothetical protein